MSQHLIADAAVAFIRASRAADSIRHTFVAEHRSQVEIDKVATGEVWYGQRAIERGLVDELKTSDSFLQACLVERDVFEVRHMHKKHWQEKLGFAAEGALERSFLKLWRAGLQRKQH